VGSDGPEEEAQQTTNEDGENSKICKLDVFFVMAANRTNRVQDVAPYCGPQKVVYGHRPTNQNVEGTFKMLAKFLIIGPEFPSKAIRIPGREGRVHASGDRI